MTTRPAHAPLGFPLAGWIFLLAFGARLLVLIRFSHSIHFLPESDDMAFYSGWAQRIAGGQFSDGQAFYGLPGYAYVLAGIFALVGFDPFTVGLLQAGLDAGVAVLIYLLAQVVFTNREEPSLAERQRPAVIGALAALAWIFFIPAQAFSIILMPTVWLVFAFYGSLLVIVRTERSSWWNPWAWLGLTCGVVAMLVATILFLLPLMLVSIGFTVERGQPLARRWPRVLAAAATLFVTVYLGMAPAWLHNRLVAHEPVLLSAHSGINFWIGNNPTANGYPKMPPGIRSTQSGLLQDSISLAEEATGGKMKRFEVSRFWSEQANRYVREHRFAWLRLMRTKFENFWNVYQYDDLSIIKLLRDDGILWPGMRFGFVAALGISGVLPIIRRFPRARWVAAAILMHMMAVLMVFVTERYRLAAVPGLILLGVAGLWSFGQSLLRGRWLAAILYVIAATGATWFVTIPRSDLSLWSLDAYKAGIRATAAGNLDRAQTSLETAYSYVQDNADIDFSVGNLWLARSEKSTDAREKLILRTRAKLCYRLALEVNPRHASTLNNLGVLAVEEKRLEVAEKFFAASVAAEPEAAKTHFLLSRARLALGNRPGAREAIRAALAIEPQQPEFQALRDEIERAGP